MRWLWTSRRADARFVRLALLPASGLWRAAMAARRGAYQRGWLPTVRLPLPTIGIGNLTVGGSGRTAVTAWAARHLAARGVRAGLLIHGGPALVDALAAALPDTVVLGGDDPVRAAREAVQAGATILLLDDAFRRPGVEHDAAIAVVSAETTRAVPWVLPAGPWREGRESSLAAADAVVITRRRATAEAAGSLAAELGSTVRGPVVVARLGLLQLRGLVSGVIQPASVLRGKRVVAATGLADPDAFVSHVKSAGGAVQVATWKDQAELRDEDVAWLAHAARRADHVVITERDAVRLRGRWAANVPEPLVAVLELTWEEGGSAITDALDRIVGRTKPEMS
ncbi:MAG TPA: tetraacyldisaccharide 4'-kinase [Gemmatimonadales bacterium]|jgi:tetraacyldisaccharide 4'-kinase|nr:tetraacyldisaccharide 4'-kinase [Gemmatimonadales bacterium]